MKRAPLLVALALAACRGDAAGPEAWPTVPLGERRVSVMTFNVENLFDASDDPAKNDDTFLPKELKRSSRHKARCARIERESWREECLNWDWNEGLVKVKLARVAEAVRLAGGAGRGPDLVLLQEIENRAILERLRAEFLAESGYEPAVLIEGDDYRGIDCALLTRLKLAGEPVLHKIPYKGMTPAQERDSRGILEATVLLPDAGKLTVFVLHLPAPFHPRRFREQALDHLGALAARLGPEAMALAGGDFNLPYGEDFEHRVLETHAPQWLVSHRFGCKGCAGTTYFPPKDEWSFLDMILLSRNLHPSGGARWVALPDSVRVANGAPQHKRRDGAPARFDPYHGTGLSDHWPVVLELAERAS